MRLFAAICFLLFLLQIEKIKSLPGRREMAKKIENYSVSGHGVENEDVKFIVPKGVTVDFYVKYGEILPVTVATEMWATLEKKAGDTYEEIGYPPVETCREGKNHLNTILILKSLITLMLNNVVVDCFQISINV